MKFTLSTAVLFAASAYVVEAATIRATVPLIVSDIPCPANHNNWLYCWTNGKDIGSCNGKLGRVTNENFYVEVTPDQGCAKLKPGAVLGPL